MIEMAEEAHFECAVSDLTFRFFDRQYTRMESEKFLYPKPRGRPVGEKNENESTGNPAGNRADST